MRGLTNEFSEMEKKSFQVLSEEELSLIKGGDQANTENGDDED